MSAIPESPSADETLPEEGSDAPAGPTIEFLSPDEEAPSGPIDHGPLDDTLIALGQLAITTMSALRAEDITVIDVRGRTSYCDMLVLCTVVSERQLRAAASQLVSHHRNVGRGRPLGVEGQDSGRWALIDMGDVLVHVFCEPWRGYYDLDGLWLDAPRVELAELGLTEDGQLPATDDTPADAEE